MTSACEEYRDMAYKLTIEKFKQRNQPVERLLMAQEQIGEIDKQ